MDKEYLLSLANKLVVTVEDNQLSGGFGSGVLEFLSDNAVNSKVIRLAINEEFLTHGSTKELLKMTGLDAESIANVCLDKLKEFEGSVI